MCPESTNTVDDARLPDAMRDVVEALATACRDGLIRNASHEDTVGVLQDAARAALTAAGAGGEAVRCEWCKGHGHRDEGDPEMGSAIMECDHCNGTGCATRIELVRTVEDAWRHPMTMREIMDAEQPAKPEPAGGRGGES